MAPNCERCHAMDHLLAGLIRKYGNNGSSVFVGDVEIEGNHTLSATPCDGGVLVEIAEWHDDENREAS